MNVFFKIYQSTYFYHLVIRQPVFLSYQSGLNGKVLTCIKFCRFCSDVYCPFLISPLSRIAFKITVAYFLLSSPVHFFIGPTCIVAPVFICLSGQRIAYIRRVPIRYSMLAIKEAPANPNTQTYCLGPTFI